MSHLDNGFRSLNLKRFPETDDVNPLMAWEAADEYLLQQLDDTEISGPVLILNDAFGALGCALAEHTPYSIGDSYLSELATRENLRHNDIEESSVKFLDSTADYPQAPGVVLIKVPKTMALLEQQLRALRKVVTPETRIIAGAKRVIFTPRRWNCSRKCSAQPPPRWRGKSASDQLYLQCTGTG
jgi:23S rRNA (guanine1835-N2)-methyltransferase